MDTVSQIRELVSKMDNRGEKIGPFIHLGRDVYDVMRTQMIERSANPYVALGATGNTILELYTPSGALKLLRNHDGPADLISINGRTLLDIIVEEELLGS